MFISDPDFSIPDPGFLKGTGMDPQHCNDKEYKYF
jgi:hypothetical protein